MKNKKIQIKFIKKKKTLNDKIHKMIDQDSLALYAEMMKGRFNN